MKATLYIAVQVIFWAVIIITTGQLVIGLLQEYHEIMDRLRKREDVHPQELYDIAMALQEEAYHYELAMLNKMAG